MSDYYQHSLMRDLAEEDRPREKMLSRGTKSLTDAELLAILIGSGTNKKNAVDLCNEILGSTEHNLVELSRLSINDFMNFKGIGEAKAISIAAALELGRRRRSADVLLRRKINSSKDVFEAMSENLMDLNHEEFWIVLLNRANKIVKRIQISAGGFSGTVADPKKIFSLALGNNASALILCHNHPSGNIEASAADKKLTQKMTEAGEVLDLPVLDHLIFGEENYFSFADESLL